MAIPPSGPATFRTMALPPGSIGTCVSAASTWYTNKLEQWATVISKPGASAMVEQHAGADHTLGIGIETSSGTWKQNGTNTMTVSNASSGSFGGITNPRRIFNRVDYRKFTTTCGSYTVDEVKPVRFSDIIANDVMPTFIVGAPYGYYCVTKTNGTYAKQAGANATFATGVSLGFISLSANSHFESSSKIIWSISSSTQLCGSGGVGWASSKTAGAW